MLNMEI